MRRRATPSLPSILCPHCTDRVPLDRGIGAPGDVTWTCRNDHEFGLRAPRPAAAVAAIRLVPALP